MVERDAERRALGVLYTQRLALQPLAPEHLAALCAMNRDERMMATLGGVASDEETRHRLERELEHWHVRGFGIWLATERGGGQVVGRGGLRRTEVEGVVRVEVAYAIVPGFWRRGLATELARASLRAGFETLGLEEIVGFTLPDNAGSRGVLEKIGMRYRGEIVHAERAHVLYAARADEWLRLA